MNGLERVGEMQAEMQGWMGRHGYSTVDAFRGKMSQGKSANPGSYERVQFMKRSVTYGT